MAEVCDNSSWQGNQGKRRLKLLGNISPIIREKKTDECTYLNIHLTFLCLYISELQPSEWCQTNFIV